MGLFEKTFWFILGSKVIAETGLCPEGQSQVSEWISQEKPKLGSEAGKILKTGSQGFIWTHLDANGEFLGMPLPVTGSCHHATCLCELFMQAQTE